MDLKNKQIIITGAAGGIGQRIAFAFAQKGSNLCLVDRTAELLAPVVKELIGKGARCIAVAGDITSDEDIQRIISETEARFGPVDVIVNNAGIMPFKLIKDTTQKEVMATLMVNTYGPIRLTQAVLPSMLERHSGRIVNIGSMFATLCFPYFGLYSSSKAAIRGFSEALRRELMDTGVGVTYIAPRATRTSQPAVFFEMAEKMKMNLDCPDKVANIVIDAVEKERSEVYIGWPERFFGLINKLKPSLVDNGLKKQIAIMKDYASRMK
ncbi:MAG: SDR family oxidoreductase [Deltaproteobacteria bacterium]|nr:SDR family oxidoreductase [Deltaproteobacteria bacterium]